MANTKTPRFYKTRNSDWESAFTSQPDPATFVWLSAIRLIGFLILFSCGISNRLVAQTNPSGYRAKDELIIQAIQKSKDNIEKANLYYQLAENLFSYDFEKGLTNGKAALQLSLKENYIQGIAQAKTAIGSYYFYQGNNREATRYYKEAVAVVAGAKNETIKEFPGKTYIRLGILYRTQAEFDSANWFQARAGEALAGQKEGLVHAALYASKGLLANALSNNDSALYYLWKSLRVRLTFGDSTRIADTWRNLGSVHSQMASYDSADYYFKLALGTAERLNEQDVLILLKINQGETDYARGNFSNAIANYSVALDKLKNYTYVRHYAYLLFKIGEVYEGQGSYNTAYNYFYEAIKESEKINARQQIARVYSHLGWSYGFLGNYTLAIEDGNRSLHIAEQIGDSAGIAQNQNLIGYALYKTKKYDEAIRYFNQSLTYRKKIKYWWGVSFTLHNLGLTYNESGQPAKAKALFLESLAMDERIGKKNGIVLSCNELGLLFAKEGNYPQAAHYLGRAYELAFHIPLPVELLNNYKNYIYLHEALGNKEKLIQYLKLYVELKDNLSSELNSNRIANTDALFQLQEKVKEIERINEENVLNQEKIKAQQTEITLQNRVILISITCLIILSLLTVVILRLLQRNRDVTRKLKKQNIEIVEMGEELMAQSEELKESNQSLLAANTGLTEKNEEIAMQSEKIEKAVLELEYLNNSLKDQVEEKTAGIIELFKNLERAEEQAKLGNWYIQVGSGKMNWSKQMFRIFGYAPQMEAPDFSESLERIHPDDRPYVKAAFDMMMKGDEPVSTIFRTNPEMLPLRYLIPTWRCTKDASGRPVKFEGTAQDITEIKEAEEKLKHQFEELQKTNHELDRFVYSVSHDLRSPLSSILGLLNVAEMEAPSPSFINYISLIRGSVNRLDGFIRDILDYSRNSRTDMLIEEIDFRDLITEIQHNLSSIAGAERLKTDIVIDSHTEFFSDRTRISIVLSNLYSNTIRYQDYRKEASGVSIRISPSAHWVKIIFSDNGIGIEQKHLAKIFDMFYRASESSKGSGLGLYIVKEALDKLKGTIQVKSDVGVYTSFEIFIPNAYQSPNVLQAMPEQLMAN